jgi:serine phosphatase RsbU (regulator of sigma subunit)
MARGAVLEVLADAGQDHLADEAAIATTELATNGVLTAGTEMDLCVEAGPEGLLVTLSDPVPSVLTPRAGPADPGDVLQGLNVIDTVASSWGTSHNRSGKSIWFRLDATPHTAQAGAGAPAGALAEPAGARFVPTGPDLEPRPARIAEPARPDRPGGAATWLTHLPEHVAKQLTPEETLAELLRRLTETIGAGNAVLWLDERRGSPPEAAAVHGLAAAPEPPTALPLYAAPPPVTACPPALSDPALREAGAASTVSIPVPLSSAVRGVLDLGFPAGGGIDPDEYALALLSAERMALTVDVSRVDEAEARRRGFLVFLAEASELLANSLDVDLTLVLVAQLCVNRLGRWCVIHTLDEHDRPALAATAHADEREIESVQKQFQGGPGDPVEQQLRRAVASRAVTRLNDELAGIVVPLTARRQVVGTMSIGEPAGRRHTPEEIIIAEDLGRRAGLALDNARLYQDREAVAKALQQGLLPASLPTGEWLRFGARYLASGNGLEVGGDFYDVLALDDDRWLLAIGDVCGKGPRAASITGLVRDVIRVLAREGRPLPYVMSALNRALLEQGDRARFCTVAAAIVTRQGDTLAVQLCLAGHLPPVRLRADGTASFVGRSGTAVGIFDEITVDSVEVELRPGESLVFYTDGVTERRNGEEFFGEENLLRAIEQSAGPDADALAAHVQAAAEEFGDGPVRDDIAVLVVQNRQ